MDVKPRARRRAVLAYRLKWAAYLAVLLGILFLAARGGVHSNPRISTARAVAEVAALAVFFLLLYLLLAMPLYKRLSRRATEVSDKVPPGSKFAVRANLKRSAFGNSYGTLAIYHDHIQFVPNKTSKSELQITKGEIASCDTHTTQPTGTWGGGVPTTRLRVQTNAGETYNFYFSFQTDADIAPALAELQH